jgi:hypothetical protein
MAKYCILSTNKVWHAIKRCCNSHPCIVFVWKGKGYHELSADVKTMRLNWPRPLLSIHFKLKYRKHLLQLIVGYWTPLKINSASVIKCVTFSAQYDHTTPFRQQHYVLQSLQMIRLCSAAQSCGCNTSPSQVVCSNESSAPLLRANI